VHLNEREKHEQKMLFWLLPPLLATVSFAFAANMAELLTFAWPDLNLHYYLGFSAAIISFMGYFSTSQPPAPDRTRSILPEAFAIVILAKAYTFFALPWERFLHHLKISRFLEFNFFFAIVILYIAWRLSREAGKLGKTLTDSFVDLSYNRQFDEANFGAAEKENITGKKLIKLLLLPTVLLLIGVIVAEQSFQVRMAEAHSLRLLINIIGGLLAASTIAVATFMFYFQKTKEWERENAQIDSNLSSKWIAWTLIFVFFFSIFATILPDDFSPVYFYVPDAIKSLLPFMHKDGDRPKFGLSPREDEPDLVPLEDGELERQNYFMLYAVGQLILRVLLFLLIVGTALYHIIKTAQENADALPTLVKKIIQALKFFVDMIKNILGKIKPQVRKSNKLVNEQLKEFFSRRKIAYNQVGFNEIRRLYAELLQAADEKGIKRESYATAKEFSMVLEEHFPERLEEIANLTDLYQEARYNDQEPDTSLRNVAIRIFNQVMDSIKKYSKKKEASRG